MMGDLRSVEVKDKKKRQKKKREERNEQTKIRERKVALHDRCWPIFFAFRCLI